MLASTSAIGRECGNYLGVCDHPASSCQAGNGGGAGWNRGLRRRHRRYWIRDQGLRNPAAFLGPTATLVAAVLGLTVLSGCVPSAPPSITPFAISPEYIRFVDYSDVKPGDCLARPVEHEGQVPVTECANSGSAVVVAATAYGAPAPSAEPSDPERDNLAHATCRPLLDAWIEASPERFEDRPPPILVMLSAETWRGADTNLICAYL